MKKDWIEIEIDGKKLVTVRGTSVIQAALEAGIPIPHFCYHKKLSVTASCRMCMVEAQGANRPMPSCAMPATDGLIIHTHTHKVTDAQKAVLEFLLINHPLDCPICDQAGECRLQDLTVGYGNDFSRYHEEKRVVFNKDAGELVSMQDMSRCIHCTRCIRFGEEIAGMQELGMKNRSDHAEIAPSVGKVLKSELSGNMIDLCPVGALTSKPFRFKARNWELSSYRSISPHDSLGSNLIVQTLNHRVMRVLPQENEDINECWISDRDRFSYEGLNSEERLTSPMIKQNNQWIQTDWATALGYVVHGLKDIRENEGKESLAALTSSQATLEEMLLVKKLMNDMGSIHVDYRPQYADFSLDGKILPWLGMSVTDIADLDSAFIIGSFLREEQPVMAIRFRQAAKKGTVISCVHGQDDDWFMPVQHKMIAAPSQWNALLAEIVFAIAKIRTMAIPEGFENCRPSSVAHKIAETLLKKGNHAVFLGNIAARHPNSGELHVMAEWIAKATGAKLGYLIDGANSVGGSLVYADKEKSTNANKILNEPRQAYLLLHTEPEMDAHNPVLAQENLSKAKMVVVMSPYRHGLAYADVILPVSPFTETAGTYVNCEGRIQSFQGVVKPLGETRPAWKVLRALGSLLELDGFEFDSSESVRDTFVNQYEVKNKLNNFSGDLPFFIPVKSEGLERLTDLSFMDPIVRRATSLMKSRKDRLNCIYLPLRVAKEWGMASGQTFFVQQGQTAISLNVVFDESLPDNVARIDGGYMEVAKLGSLFGPLQVRGA